MKTPEEMTDQELSEAVHVEVAGGGINGPNRGGLLLPQHLLQPAYATYAAAVLPLLEKAKTYDVDYMSSEIDDDPDHYRIRVDTIAGCAPTFARAACIALLKAARTETGHV